MNERAKFVLEWARRFEAAKGGRVNVSELCLMFGVSRQTGYVWINRYRDAGRDLRVLQDRSRRPHTHPNAVTPKMEDLVVEARKKFPRWGPRTLRRWLADRLADQPIPSHATISKILARRGMVVPRLKRRRRDPSVVVTPPFPECTAPNDTWCMDFKGWFRTRDRAKCYPLTLFDSFSRFLLRCEALTEPNGIEVQRILASAFTEFGLPTAMRSDGGPPFASTGASCLSSLMVWLLKLGLTIELIAPGKPQQNGRLERFHRTLKLDVPPAASVLEQQRAFDVYRGEYNFQRPHHSLSLNTPGSVYRRSRASYPRKLLGPELLVGGLPGHIEKVDRYGFIRWHRRRLFVSEALAFEHVILWPEDGAQWSVWFGPIALGRFDGHRHADRIAPIRRPKGTLRLSLYSDD